MKVFKLAMISALLGVSALTLTACGKKDDQAKGSQTGATQGQTPVSAAVSGSGASFPAPLYSQWAADYQKQPNGGTVNYQSMGSSAGIKQIKDKLVDFGATDAPLSADDLKAAGLVQFPAVIGGLVPIVNLKGVDAGKLKLTGAVLADIFLGKITKWNDKAIADLNAGVTLPDLTIQPVYRSDGSGTTFVFTDYLSQVSPEWKEKIGAGQSVNWAKGSGAKGNDGVAKSVGSAEGSIGYVEYAFAKKGNLAHASLKNKDGEFVQPEPNSFKAAAANADWGVPNFAPNLNNGAGKATWPITSATYILVYQTPEKADNVSSVLKFFEWGYQAKGAEIAAKLEYVPLPDDVVTKVKALWSAQIKDKSGKVLYTASK